MLIPRIGALILFIGFGFGFATFARLAFVVGVEGYWSWAWALLFLLPTAGLGMVSAVLVMRRKPLGAKLVLPFAALAVVSIVLTLVSAPPIGRFMADYERASLERGIEVPPYEREQGVTPEEYAQSKAGELRLQAGLGYLAAVAAYVVLVRRSTSRTKKPTPPQAARANA